jgi:hypothetical protein
VGELGQVGRDEQQVHQHQRDRTKNDQPPRHTPPPTDNVEEQQSRDSDRAGHRNTVRISQTCRTAEHEDQDEHRDHQQPVDPRHVDLTHPVALDERGGEQGAVGESMADLEAELAQLQTGYCGPLVSGRLKE